jgi:gliding motility-associated-like protein
MKQNYSIVLLFILLVNGLLISQTDNNSFHYNDVFQTGFFIENKGQFNNYSRDQTPILFGLNNDADEFYFDKHGFRMVNHPLSTENEKPELPQSKLKHHNSINNENEEEKEEEKENSISRIRQFTDMKWIGANEAVVIEKEEKSLHYFTYGEDSFISYGFKKIIYKELYPHIDVAYTIPEKGGIEYSIILHPGYQLSNIRFSYFTDDIYFKKKKTGIYLKEIFEKDLSAYDEEGHPIELSYEVDDEIISFQTTEKLDTTKSLYIDPWVRSITTLTSLSASSNRGYDVDYDIYGNLYVYGGGTRSIYSPENFKVAKYNAAGTLLWTFNGAVSSIAWESKGTGGSAGNFCVNKFDEKVYVGQGYYDVGTRVVRLNRLGVFDGFTNFPLIYMKEMWELKFNCNNGDVFVYGGGPTSNKHVGKIDTTTTDISLTNFTADASFAQDVVCAAIDLNNDMYVLLSSESLPSINNHIYKLNSTRTGTLWNVSTGFSSFDEEQNKPYFTTTVENSNGYNALFAANYLFYYDGLNLKAFNKTTGAAVGSTYSLPGFALKQQGGIFADECNDVYVGGDNGNVKAFIFDGTNFLPQPDIIIPSSDGKAVYDIDYCVTTNQLCVAGNELVANITPSLYCTTISLDVSTLHLCPNMMVATISPAVPTDFYSYTWMDSVTGSVIRTISNTHQLTDTILTLFPERTYYIIVTKDVRCGRISDTATFIYHCCIGDSVVNHINFCTGQILMVGRHSYSSAGVYRDTLISSRSCDSIIVSYLTYNTPIATQNIYTCFGDTLRIGSHFYYSSGTFIDTLSAFGLCDSILTSHLSFSSLPMDTINFTICSSHPITMGSHVYTVAGIYLDTFRNHLGCDSIIVSNIVASSSSATTQDITLCTGFIRVGPYIHFSSGTYYDTLVNIFGCDSLVITNFLTNLAYVRSMSLSMCPGDTIRVYGIAYTTPGSHVQVYSNVYGCDSTISIFINLRPPTSMLTTYIVCVGDIVSFRGRTYSLPGIFYDTVHTAGLCDTIYRLNIIANILTLTSRSYSVCPHDTLHLGMKDYYAAGVYNDTFHRIGECDSVHTITISVLPYTIFNQSIGLCYPDSFFVNRHSYYISGRYSDTIQRLGICDSIVNTTIFVTYPSVDSQVIHLCHGESTMVGSHSYSFSGNYNDTIRRIGFCDSLVYTTIDTIPIKLLNQSLTNCAGDTFKINRHQYFRNGTYYDTIRGMSSCDSFVISTLTFMPLIKDSQIVDICYPSTLHVGANIYSSSGSYADTLTSHYGCDSILSTHLTVHRSDSTYLSTMVCRNDTIRIGSDYFYVGGDYNIHLNSIYGCDSIVLLHLTLMDPTFTHQDISLCHDSVYNIDGHRYSSTGDYLDTLNSYWGCDSIVETNLFIASLRIVNIDSSACVGDSFFSIQINSDTTLTTYLMNSFACDSIIVNYHLKALSNLPLSLLPDQHLCLGDSAIIQAFGGATGIYDWSPNLFLNCNYCASVVSIPKGDITYIVKTENCLHDTISDSVSIMVHLPPVGSILNHDTTLYRGQAIDLNFNFDSLNPLLSSIFYDDVKDYCSNCNHFYLYPYESKLYYFRMVNEFGCLLTDSIEIIVDIDCDNRTIEIPNFITPNEDGSNDLFFIKNKKEVPVLSIDIFDRWGENIFHSNNEKDTWNGIFNGQIVPAGVYVYQIRTNCIDARSNVLYGNITVLR